MVIPRALVSEMIAHAHEGEPEEVCGILARDGDGTVTKLYRITNAEHSPRFYVMDSQEQLRALLDIDDQGLEVAAVYHSHPATEPRPSKTDIELAKWPGTLFVIVSIRDTENPEVRAWSIEDGEVAEESLTIADSRAL